MKSIFTTLLAAAGLSLPVSAQVTLSAKVFLQGALLNSSSANLMRNDLQTKGLLPAASTAAYPLLPMVTYAAINSSAGPAGPVVDWVQVQLRDAATPATVIESRAFLLQADGDVVTPAGGTSLSFSAPPGNYFVAVLHRNHLGVMTLAAQTLSAVPVPIDFTTGAGSYGTNAQYLSGGINAMWPGNANQTLNANGKHCVCYNSGPSDVDHIRDAVKNASGNLAHITTYVGPSVTNVYHISDLNLDGDVRYSTSPSDVDFTRRVVVGYPANLTFLITYADCVEQLP